MIRRSSDRLTDVIRVSSGCPVAKCASAAAGPSTEPSLLPEGRSGGPSLRGRPAWLSLDRPVPGHFPVVLGSVLHRRLITPTRQELAGHQSALSRAAESSDHIRLPSAAPERWASGRLVGRDAPKPSTGRRGDGGSPVAVCRGPVRHDIPITPLQQPPSISPPQIIYTVHPGSASSGEGARPLECEFYGTVTTATDQWKVYVCTFCVNELPFQWYATTRLTVTEMRGASV